MIALVTGASSGFGEAIARLLVHSGHRVIGTGRRQDRLANIKNDLGNNFFSLVFDIKDIKSTNTAIDSLPSDWKDIDVLINNAGLALGLEPAHEACLEDWRRMIETNICGLVQITHSILKNMVKRNRGRIINIGSIAGTYPYPGGNIYGATKAFVRQFSLNLKADLLGTAIQITNIEPGLCSGTEFSLVRFRGDSNKAKSLYEGVTAIQPIDIANTVLWICNQPEHININSIEIMPVAQSFGSLNIKRS